MSGEEIPIYLGDYVLATYGTGAIMAVPAHDQRDFEFARKYGIPVRVVIQGEEPLDGETMTEAYTGPGTMVNSGEYDGHAERKGLGGDRRRLEPSGGWASGKSTTASGTGSSPGSGTGACRSR